MTALSGYRPRPPEARCPYCGDAHGAIEADARTTTDGSLLYRCWCGASSRETCETAEDCALPSDPPDPPWQGPKRCECGYPISVRHGDCVGKYAIEPDRLTKRPDPMRTVGWWPMEWLEDLHSAPVVSRYAMSKPQVERGTKRCNDKAFGRVAWCPLEPLLALIPEDGAS